MLKGRLAVALSPSELNAEMNKNGHSREEVSRERGDDVTSSGKSDFRKISQPEWTKRGVLPIIYVVNYCHMSVGMNEIELKSSPCGSGFISVSEDPQTCGLNSLPPSSPQTCGREEVS